MHKNILKTDIYNDTLFDPATSIFVSANAGSGKTSQLTNRVLSLLLYGVKPDKILCLTFTNAAAAEMKQRVLNVLGAWVMAEEKKLHTQLFSLLGRAPDTTILCRARSLFATVLEAPEGVRIQTIHGFCQSLLARFPIEAGISPHFSICDTRTAADMLHEAKLQLLTDIEDEPQLAAATGELARLLSADDFHALLETIIKNKYKFQALQRLPGGFDRAIEKLWKKLGISPESTLTSLFTQHFTYDEITERTLNEIAHKLLEGKDTDKKLGELIHRWCADPSTRYAMLEEYASGYLTKEYKKRDRERGKFFTKNALQDENHIHVLLTEQERVSAFHDARQSLEIGRLSRCVMHIAQSLLTGYDAIKSARARMDYDDLILIARELLERPAISAWVLYKLDGGIDHVLIDEAQDTSPEQWRIATALTEDFFAGQSRSESDRSVFIVGDEKQSIFSFQGADVRQLALAHKTLEARIDASGKKMLAHSLIKSFRSTPEVLRAVDAVFATPEAKAGVYSGEEPLRHIAHRNEDSGVVELWPLLTLQENGGSPHAQLAKMLGETIRNWLGTGRWEAGDIMILVRTRTSFVDHMVRALKRLGVPVAGVDRMVLTDNLAVQDLLALGKCLLLPDDDLTLAALLKSPIGHFSEEELFALCWNRGEKTLWQRLQESAETVAICGEAYALLSNLRAKVDFLAPYELYTHLLDTLGFRRNFLGRMGDEYADPIDEFLSQALIYQQENAVSLQGFLHWLESSESEIKRDMEQAQNAVRIMTVHGAKGLQAPVVILPDTVKKPDLRDKPFWLEEEGEPSLPLWVRKAEDDNRLSAACRKIAAEAMLEEYRRLLYVAMTRAEDRLYICGATSHKKANEQSWYGLIQHALEPLAEKCETPAGEGLRLGNPVSLTAGDTSAERGYDIPPQKTSSDIFSPEGGEDYSFLTQPPPAESIPPKPLAPSRGSEEPAASSPLSTEVYARGLYIHLLLQHLPSLPPGKRMAAAQSLAVSYIMPEAEKENCIREATAIIESPEFSFLFASGSLAEIPVGGTVEVKGEPFVVSGQIDRLAIGKEDIWIVDYKTNRLPPGRIQEIPAAYIRQLSVYRLLLKHIYSKKTIRCALLWTAAPRMDVLDEVLLDTYI